jgi:hypothetical protein
VLYAYIYLDPAKPPGEVMLQWNNGSWEHRAYWGANSLAYGTDGTASRRYMGPLPATGQWVQLKVSASQVGLEGSTLNGMAFTLYNGRATWDAAGRLSQAGTATAQATVTATVTNASRTATAPGVFTIARTGSTSSAMTVSYALTGNAVNGVDYLTSSSGSSITIPAGSTSANLTISALPTTNVVSATSVTLTLASNSVYNVATPNVAVVSVGANIVPITHLTSTASGTSITWSTTSNRLYEVAYKTSVTNTQLIIAKSGILATNSTTTWVDTSTNGQRYYAVAQTN